MIFVVRKLQAKVVAFYEVEVVAHCVQQHLPRGSLWNFECLLGVIQHLDFDGHEFS